MAAKKRTRDPEKARRRGRAAAARVRTGTAPPVKRREPEKMRRRRVAAKRGTAKRDARGRFTK